MRALRWFFLVAGLLALFFAPSTARAQGGVSQWVSPGPLAQDHAHIEGLTQCTKCHAPLMGVTTDRCVACHESVAGQIKSKSGFHSDKAERCGTCHPDHRGRDFALARVELSAADHARETGFPLDGAHRSLKCLECHETGNWSKAEPECNSCHRPPHGRAQDLEHIEVDTCDECHNTVSWSVRSVPVDVFDHTDRKQTDYVLEGAHLDVGCVECHIEAVFAPVRHETCTSCHKDPHHKRFPQPCTECHTVETWVVGDFDHNQTGFALEGQHGRVTCEKCHKGGDVSRPIKHDTCGDCHKDIHRGQFVPRACDACHTVTVADFRIDPYDHDKTQFPLLGEHRTVACEECHGKGPAATYLPVEHADCDACHDDVHEGSFEPTDCRVCHTENGWHTAQEDFDHDRTDFPLRGSHTEVDCEKCHPEQKWSGIAHDSCVRCHEEDQPHGTFFTADRCDGCHDEAEWPLVEFAHAEQTDFDLEPQHSSLPCKDCHEALDAFSGLETGCRGCHEDDTPAGHYEGACEECHRTDAWLPADLGGRSHDITGYPLVGTHELLACEDCHGPERKPLSAGGTACVDCHATDDAHRNLIGAPCDDCHTPTTWIRTRFRHGTTGWPLRGAHRLAYCDDCHAVSYAGTPNECWRCHEASAPRSEPAHQSSFFPQCDLCHRPYTWNALPADFIGTGATATGGRR